MFHLILQIFSRCSLKSIGLATALVSTRFSCSNGHFEILSHSLNTYFSVGASASQLFARGKARLSLISLGQASAWSSNFFEFSGCPSLASFRWCAPQSIFARRKSSLILSFYSFLFLCTKLKLKFVSTKKPASLSTTRKNCVKLLFIFLRT